EKMGGKTGQVRRTAAIPRRRIRRPSPPPRSADDRSRDKTHARRRAFDRRRTAKGRGYLRETTRGEADRSDRAEVAELFRLLLRRRVLQQRPNVGCSRWTDAATRSAPTTSGSAARSSSRSSAASSSAIAGGSDEIDRLLAVSIDELGSGSLLQKVTNQVRAARLRRSVESRHTFFVRRGVV